MAVVRDIEPWDALLEAGPRGRAARHAGRAEPAPGARRSRCPTSCTRTSPPRCAARGVDQLWSHQAEALHAAWAGPTIVTTGTASGKSLCFQLPTLDTLCRDARARALYLYPTKALAQDQARALHALGVERARPAIYDGDTPREQRAQIRRRANVVLTNPDMLHLGILPEPPGVGGRVRQPRRRRGRRGARLPRRVRLARRQRAAAAAPDRRRLRDRAALPARQRDDRQPGRARRAADRARRRHGRRPRRLARARARRSPCGTRRSPTSSSPPGARRWPRPPTCSPSWSARARGRSCS